jgi:F420 biosynthesis protein FbiB-like protein
MTSLELLYQRRTVRRFDDRPVPPASIQALLDAAIRAPSPHNRQPWRFAVVTGPARVRLADAMAAQLRADLERDGAPADAITRDTDRSRQRISGAPVAILACLSMADMDACPDARRALLERWMAGQAVAAAIQNLLLAASDLGLGACWMCAPLFCPDTAIAALDLPADWEPQALILAGYPAPDTPARSRERVPVDHIMLVRDI